VKARILATAASLFATGLLAGCYVIPIDPRHTAVEQPQAALPQGAPPSLQARLYPLNEIAGGMGPLSVTLIEKGSGHASFSLTYAGELLHGEATRVGQRGVASAAGARGLYVNCEYAISAPNRGSGTCLFSNGAKYQVHFGS